VKDNSKINKLSAFTLIELIVVIAVVALVTLVVIPTVTRQFMPRRSSKVGCSNNLKQVGLSFRLWANDNRDQFPMQVSTNAGGTLEFVETPFAFRHLQALSNELSTPRVLQCPHDKRRGWATNFTTDLNNGKVSYFVGVDAQETNATMFLSGDRNITSGRISKNGMLLLTTNQTIGWTKEIHVRCGNIGLSDGSVQSVDNSALRRLVRNTGVATNRLAMP